MVHGRSRRRAAPFRAWGTPVVTLLAVMLLTFEWWPAIWLLLVLVYYLVAVRVTPCRVATYHRRPCRWRVSGLHLCCDWHSGLKGGSLCLVRVRGHLLPMAMWRRRDAQPDWHYTRREPQPRESGQGIALLSPNCRSYRTADRIMLGLMLVSLLVVGLAFWRAMVLR